MASQLFGSLVELQSASEHAPITSPSAVAHKERHPSVTSAPSVQELDDLRWGKRLSSPAGARVTTSDQLSQTPNDPEQSLPSTPQDGRTVDLVQSFTKPRMNVWRVLAACFMSLANGLNDGAAGALIPKIEEHYKIGYAVVSLIFVAQALGFIIAAPFTHALEHRLGRAKTYCLAEGSVSIACVIIICQPPFPLVVIAFLPVGFGIAVNLALNNVFCANLVNSTVTLGALHGSYGIGGTIGPLITTALISRGAKWSIFYTLPLFVTSTSIAFAGWSFWSYEKDLSSRLLTALEQTTSRQRATEEHEVTKAEILGKALKNKTTLLGALFIFAYQGAEVSISGWVISFLINYRGGDPAHVGNVTAGFFGGITLGRFLLVQPAKRVGEKASVFGLVIGAAAFQLLVWLVPNVIGDAVAVSVVGLLLGPIYPCTMTVFSRLLPKDIQMSSLSFTSAMGSSGGAVAPFFTGLLAQKVGTVVLHPIAISLFIVMEISWGLLPKTVKRTE